MSEPNPPLRSSTFELYRPVEVFVARPPLKRRYWLHALLFLLTVLTTTLVGAYMQHNFEVGRATFSEDSLFPTWALGSPSRLLLGIPFSATLLLILLTHEMGHFLFCVHYGVNATLPFFVPAPTPIGTFGALIRIRSPIRSRPQLFDIGIAGPFAGFFVAVIALVIGLRLSVAAPLSPDSFAIPVGYPLIFVLVQHLLAGTAPADSILHLPLARLNLHPMAIAAWVGMLATALNLIPAGQLDGGHIVHALSPKWHRRTSKTAIAVLLAMCWWWMGWLMWSVLLRIFGTRHPTVPVEPGLGRVRHVLAVFGMALLALTFIPVPFAGSGVGDFLRQLQMAYWPK